ncbi:TIGR00659 family protein [Carboxydocella sporoproducens DSM 16521]|uniref:TIGR00659 family protein n=2 Tax=Carboxydocella TaxID=178898 RepID=A0A1T4M163_9FIRM|nr:MULTISPECIES: LrgB family protein [Carboxydocella]AVX21102.1 TIGR00659 family protein [Carboxydocella thermautotrophica]AVX31537.1 TIGR00659 family protein [Carboxydocella thermautotrophica]SJZ60464.1 TIGR00659 family protein [Carboxydocella sporoproducens DSM 16521]
MITFFSIILTILCYWFSRKLFLRTGISLLNPVIVSTTIIILVLSSFNLTFDDYKQARDIMTFLLGPATVALAVPLYRNSRLLKTNLVGYLTAIAAGAVSSMFTVLGVGLFFQLQRTILLSLAPKSVTAPIALEIARIIGGDPALAVAFVVATGMIGAAIGPWLMNKTGINDAAARGLALGTTSHGQGTAIALQEGETQGALAGVAMAVAAILTSFLAPWIVAWF